MVAGKTLTVVCCRYGRGVILILNDELDTGVGDALELEHTLVVRRPWSNRHSVSAENDVMRVRRYVAEGDSVRLDSSSTHLPNLVATISTTIIEMFVMPAVWHADC